MIFKVGILGCTGRMGRQLCDLLGEGFEHGGDCLELADAVCLNKKLVSIEGVAVRTLAETSREPVHGWIDFSRPEATLQLISQISTPVLVGTTGFSNEQYAKLEAYAKSQPLLLAPNTSPGMNCLYGMLADMPIPEWLTEVVVVEEHHRRKLDSPSGTAKEIISILQGRGVDMSKVQVHSIRGGGSPGIHSVRLLGEYEEIELTHRVTNRQIFARGALMAAWWLIKQKSPGLYRMKDFMKEKI